MTIDATVILPTFRRPRALERALASLAAQRAPGLTWELVVIDNDDPPGSEAVFRAGVERLPVPARYVREPRRGVAHARNLGIAEASGGIVAMMDDDVVAAEDWLARLLEPILSGRCDGTGGRVLLDPAVPRPRWFDELGIGAYLASWDLGHQERDLVYWEIVLTANAAFRADLLRETGGFDPSLGPRGRLPMVADDNLLVRKFRACGGRMRWVPAAVVIHELTSERLSRGYLLRRAYAQGRSEWILDRELLSQRKLNGARVALGWLGHEFRLRWREGIHRPAVSFHVATDLARTFGALREAASWALPRRT